MPSLEQQVSNLGNQNLATQIGEMFMQSTFLQARVNVQAQRIAEMQLELDRLNAAKDALNASSDPSVQSAGSAPTGTPPPAGSARDA